MPYQRKGARDWKGGQKFGEKKPWEHGPGSREGGKGAMHTATCSTCGKSCQVPFRPNGSRPVFCSYCFKKDGAEPRFGGERSSERPMESKGSEVADQLKKINTKLDTILEMLDAAE